MTIIIVCSSVFLNFASLKLISFLADRTNGRAIAPMLRLSVVCDVM